MLNRKKNKKKWGQFRDLWDNIKCTNVCTIGVQKGEEREKGVENIVEEIIAENLPNLEKETDIQIQEVQIVPYKINPKRNTPRHIVNKMAKIEDREY